jgi:hypothetical protein
MGKAHAGVGRVRSAKGRPPRRPCLRESVSSCAGHPPRYANGRWRFHQRPLCRAITRCRVTPQALRRAGLRVPAFITALSLRAPHPGGGLRAPLDRASPLSLASPLAWHRRSPAAGFRPLVTVAGIPAVRLHSRPATCRKPFISFGVSASVNSRLQVNGLTFARVVKAKFSPLALWITRITGISQTRNRSYLQVKIVPGGSLGRRREQRRPKCLGNRANAPSGPPGAKRACRYERFRV